MATNGNNSKNYTFKNTNVMEAKILKLTDTEFRRVALKSASVVFLSALLFLFNLLNAKAANYYWVGNSGNWNDVSHWATTSGGTTFHTVLPGVNDDVFFDDNSFSFSGTDTVFVFNPTIPTCRNFSFVNTLPIPRGGFASNSFGGHGISFQIRGNLEVSGPIANYGLFNNDVLLFTFWSTQPVQYIQTSGNRMNIDLYSSNTATYNLLDDLDGSFLVRNGKLNTNGHTLNITSFLSRVEYLGIIDFGSSIINSTINAFNSFECCCGGRIIADSATFFLPISEFVHNNNSLNSSTKIKSITAKNIYSTGDTIDNCSITGIAKVAGTIIENITLNGSSCVFFNDTSSIFQPNNSISKFIINADTSFISGQIGGFTTSIDSLVINTGCKNLILKNGCNTSVNSYFQINTTSGNNTKVNSDVPGTAATLTKNSGTLCFNNLDIQDINAAGGAQFYAGANSNNLGGNTGWQFTNCASGLSYYWVGGTGNWSDVSHWATTSGGTTFHTTPPDSTSDVYFDGNSSLTTNDTIYTPSSIISCKNFTSANITSAFHFGYPISLITVHGSLNINPYLVFISAAVNMLSNNSGNTIQTNGNNSISYLAFTGGGEWSLLDSLYVVSNISISDFCTVNLNSNNITSGVDFNLSSQAILNTGSATLTAGEFYFDTGIINGAGSRLITTTGGGASFLNGTGYDIIINNYQVIGNFTCNKIYCYYQGGQVYGNFNCNYLECHNHCYLDSSGHVGRAIIFDDADIGNLTFDTLILYNPGSSIRIMQNDTITINNALIANSVSGNTISISTLPAGSSGYINKSSGQICLQNVSLQNINTTGGAQFFAGNGCIDLGGNTGWIWAPCSPSAPGYYWVGGTGNWSDVSHWATTSGGTTFYTVPPGINDDVYFDANSFTSNSDTVKVIGAFATCNSFNWDVPQLAPVIIGSSIPLTIAGDLNLQSNFDWQVSDLRLTSSNGTILTNGNQLLSVTIDNNSMYQLADDIKCGYLDLLNTNFNSNNRTLTVGNIDCRQSPIEFGTSIINIVNDTNSFGLWSKIGDSTNVSNATINLYKNGGWLNFNNTKMNAIKEINVFANSSGVNSLITGPFNCGKLIADQIVSITPQLFMGNRSFINKAVFKNNVYLNTGIIIDTLLLDNPGYTTQLTSGDTLFINNAFLSSYSSGLFGLITSTLPTYISMNNGIVCLNNISLQNIHTIGGAQFFAGNGCVDLGGNTGWQFAPCSPPSAYYWVGGTGNWSDVSHWATTSGGTTFHTTPPDSTSDVYFDANSFLVANHTVTDTASSGFYYVSCRNLDFSGIAFNSRLNFSNTAIKIHGSLAMTNKFTQLNVPEFRFEGTGINSITNNHCTNNPPYRFYGGGTYNLTDSLTASLIEQYNGGILKLNGNFLSGGLANIAVNIDLSGGTVQGSLLSINGLNPAGSRINVIGAGGGGPSYLIGEFDEIYLDPSATNHWITGSFKANKIFDLAPNLSSRFDNIVDCDVLTINGNAQFNDSLTANRFVLNGAVLLNNSSIDTLLIGQQCDSINITAGSILRINNEVANNAIFSSKPVIKSSVAGIQASVQKSGGIICLKNMQLKNISFIGGAQFFADTSCIDLGGNNGIIFTSCTNVSDVWPGDANYDLTVNNNDVLNIGVAYGNTGPLRTGASLAYVAQPATDWSGYFANAVNHKHADTNGDGVVDNNDTTAISLNYGLTHPARLAGNTQQTFTGPQLYLQASADSVAEGDTVEFDIYLGDTFNPINNIYGLAFTINIDAAFVDTVYSNFDFNGCWMGTEGVDLLTYNHPVWNQNKIDVALTRTTQTDTSGYGYLGRVGVVIVDNVGARILSPGYVTMPVSISNVYGIDYAQNVLSITTLGDSVVIDTAGTVNINNIVNLNSAIDVFPNPTKDKINIRSSKINIESAELINTLGSVFIQTKAESNSIALNLELVGSGIYLLRIKTDKGVLNKKVQVIKYK